MEQTRLKLTGTVHVAPSADKLYDDLANVIMQAASTAVKARGVFHLALSGGSTPEKFYVRLVIDPRFRPIPWKETHIWIVDERRVPEDDDKSNFRMIRQTLVDHVPVRRRHVHPMPTMVDDPAGVYEQELRGVFQMSTGVPRLDFVLLGMGDDAHTASLFPGSPALKIHDSLIANNEGSFVTPPPRVTMTYPLINAARSTGVLITGSKKADTLRMIDVHLKQSGPDPHTMPITGVDPIEGELTWYLDPAAAGS